MGFDHNLFSFVLIIITGIFTTVTDLRHQKIRNNHLIVIVVVTVVFTIARGLSEKSFSMLQISSILSAVIIAGVFYKCDLWRPGDAKLFVVFSSLMPVTGYESRIYFPSIALFANAFILGLIILSVLLIKDLVSQPKLVHEIIFKDSILSIIRVTFVTSCVSWMVFPLFHAFRLTQYGIFSFLVIYIINISLGLKISRLIDHKLFILTVFAAGLFLRYEFLPGFFLWKNILFYFSHVLIYSAFSFILYRGTRYLSKSNDRVPFAPLLFMGCLLSYTPFLGWIMSRGH
ncbi:MAG: hypothetical protein HQL14_06720 [Candidatus Omnitrophica bacterium]|nr:hypothetical protein [Candidatus Omnitrophota bacterium]